MLLNANDSRQILGKTPKFLPTHGKLARRVSCDPIATADVPILAFCPVLWRLALARSPTKARLEVLAPGIRCSRSSLNVINLFGPVPSQCAGSESLRVIRPAISSPSQSWVPVQSQQGRMLLVIPVPMCAPSSR